MTTHGTSTAALGNASEYPSNAGDPFGFRAQCGYYADGEIGLYYCQNRYYDL